MKRFAFVLIMALAVGMLLFASPKEVFEKYGMKNAFQAGYSITYSNEDDDWGNCSYEFTKRNSANPANERLQFTNTIIKSVLASHPDATTYDEYYDTVTLKTLTKAPEEWQSVDINFKDGDYDVSVYISYYLDGRDQIIDVSLYAYESYDYDFDDIDWDSFFSYADDWGSEWDSYDYDYSDYGWDDYDYGWDDYDFSYDDEEKSSHFDTTYLYELLSAQTLAERQMIAESSGATLETRADGAIVIREKDDAGYSVIEKNGDLSVYDADGTYTKLSMYWPKDNALAKLVKEPSDMNIMFTAYNEDVFMVYFENPDSDQFKAYGESLKKAFPLETEFIDEVFYGMYMYMFTGRNSDGIYCGYMKMEDVPMLIISTEEI